MPHVIDESRKWIEQIKSTFLLNFCEISAFNAKSVEVRPLCHQFSLSTIIRVAFGGEFDVEWMKTQWVRTIE